MAPAEAMNVVVFYHNNYTAPVMGTVTSSPDACNTLIEQPAFFGYAMCPITPSSGSGTETVAFTLTIFNAEMQQYHFDLNAGMISLSGSTNSEVSGSISKSDFYVTVANQQPTFTITIAAPPPVAVTIDGSVQTPGPVTVTESPGLHTISVHKRFRLPTA